MKRFFICTNFFIILLGPVVSIAAQSDLCLDNFCIGQSISDSRFDKVEWKTPKKDMTKDACNGVGCQPANAFPGYALQDQSALAEAVSWKYGMMGFTILTQDNLPALRKYKYECNPSARGMWGERRFFGAYGSTPSQYITVVGLRLIDGELRVFRIAREYPYHNQNELVTLAKGLHNQYGNSVLFYDGISSNAPYEVVQKHKSGWFARSSLFNVNDLANNTAELVIIDPATRDLLQPTSMPESGEIKPLPVQLPAECNRSLPLQ